MMSSSTLIGAKAKVSPQRGRGRPAKATAPGEMRRCLIDAAIACFAARGYAATSTREIAERGGVTTNLLYHYFGSKAALFREALVDVTQRLLTIYREASQCAPEATSLEQLVLGLRGAVELARSAPDVMRFAGQAEGEIRRHPELLLSETEGRDAFIAFFRELLDRALARGELDPALGVEPGVRVLSAFMIRLAIMSGEPAAAEEFAQNIAVFERILKGEFLRALPAAGQPGP